MEEVSINMTLDLELHRAAKVAAAKEGKTLKDFVIEAIREAVCKQGG